MGLFGRWVVFTGGHGKPAAGAGFVREVAPDHEIPPQRTTTDGTGAVRAAAIDGLRRMSPARPMMRNGGLSNARMGGREAP